MRNFRDFHHGMGGGGGHLSFFSADSVGPSLARQVKTIRNSDVISDFFFLETKVSIRLPVRRLVWAFVVRMYQTRISRDKVHTISKNSKLNVKVYTRYTPGVFVFPFVRSSFPMFIILLINCSFSLSLSLSLSLYLSLSRRGSRVALSLSLSAPLSLSLSLSLARPAYVV